MTEVSRANRVSSDTSALLLEAARVHRARAHYGPGDRRLVSMFDRAFKLWRADLDRHGELSVAIDTEGMHTGCGEPPAMQRELGKFHTALLDRGACELRFSSDLEADAFVAFFEALVMKNEDIEREGGFAWSVYRRAPSGLLINGVAPTQPPPLRDAVEEEKPEERRSLRALDQLIPLPDLAPDAVAESESVASDAMAEADSLESDSMMEAGSLLTNATPEPSPEEPDEPGSDSASSERLGNPYRPAPIPLADSEMSSLFDTLSDLTSERFARALPSTSETTRNRTSDTQPLEAGDTQPLDPGETDAHVLETDEDAELTDLDTGSELDANAQTVADFSDDAELPQLEIDESDNAEASAILRLETDDGADAPSAPVVAEPPASEGDSLPESSADYDELFVQLGTADENTYEPTLEAALYARPTDRPEALFDLALLLSGHAEEFDGTPRGERALRGLHSLAHDGGLETWLERSLEDGEPEGPAAKILQVLPERTAPILLRDLVKERDEDRRQAGAKLFASLGEPARDAVLAQLMNADPASLLSTARLLREFRLPAPVGPLAKLLNHEQGAIREEAAGALANRDDAEAVNALRGALLHGRDELRRQAAVALGRCQGPGVRETLAQALASCLAQDDNESAKEVIFALGKQGQPECAPILAELLQKKKRFGRRKLRELKLTAVGALAKIPGDGAAAALSRVGESRDAQLRRAAELALSRREAWLKEDASASEESH